MALNQSGYTGASESLLKSVQSGPMMRSNAVKQAYARYANLVGNPETTRSFEDWVSFNMRTKPQFLQDLMASDSMFNKAKQMGSHGPNV